MSSPSLSPDEIRAAAEIHRDLGPDYQSAVIESFLDKVGREIDARVDARVAAAQPRPPAPATSSSRGPAFALAVVSMALGIPLTAISVAAGSHPVGLGGVVVIWLAIAIINVAYAVGHRPPPPRRR